MVDFATTNWRFWSLFYLGCCLFCLFLQWVFFPIVGRKFLYPKVAKEKFEAYVFIFEMKLVSTIIAIIVTTVCILNWLLIPEFYYSDKFDYFYQSPTLQAALLLYGGYMIGDVPALIKSRPINHEWKVWLFHHVVGTIACVFVTKSGTYHGGFWLFMTEITTPFINNFYILSFLEIKGLSMINSAIALFLWALVRIWFGGIYFIYLLVNQWPKFFDPPHPYFEIFYNYFVTFSFFSLNVFWFFKLVRGFINIVAGKKKASSSKKYRRKLF